MARDFDGSTDRIDWGNVFDPNGSDITAGAWVYADSTSSNQSLFIIHTASDAAPGFQLWIYSTGRLQVKRNTSGTDPKRARYGTGGIGTGAWEHWCATSDSGGAHTGMEVYVDGAVPSSTSTSSKSGTEYSHTGSFSVGGEIPADTTNLNGRICEVGVWDRLLAADEIAALAKGYSPKFFLRGLRFYVPLIGRKDVDIVGGKTPSYDGTSVIEHPRIIYPS